MIEIEKEINIRENKGDNTMMEKLEKTSQVTASVQHLQKAITHLAEVRERLETRLETILRPAIAMPDQDQEGTCDKDKVQRVPLAEELDRMTFQIDKLQFDLDNMLSRIEL